MLLKVIQWNIGGAKTRKVTDPVAGFYTNEGIEYVEELLKKYDADIITLQETHANAQKVQVESLAKKLNLLYVFNDIYDKSHIEEGQNLGQAVLSRFPISHHTFNFLLNPHFEAVGPDGRNWVSHDKGVSKCLVTLGEEKTIQVCTLHLIPFSIFNVNPVEEEFKELRKNIIDLTNPSENIFLLQGDFNFDNASLKEFLPDLLNKNISEILLDTPTTPKGRNYDHVMFKGLKHIRSEVIADTLTDHFPVYSEFEI